MNKHTCPRRNEIGQQQAENKDTWTRRDGFHRCNYCGSIHPDEFMEAARSGLELGPTDKNYKVYVDNHAGKFYFQHLPEAQKREFIDLLNSRSLNIGYPGHFYRLPFFIQEPSRS